MRLLRARPATAIALLFVSMLLGFAPPQLPKDSSPAQIVSSPEYPDSADGLKALIADIFVVMKSGDSAKTSSYISSLMIPDHGTWFVKVFGSVEGSRLKAKYEELLPKEPDRIKRSFEYALTGGRTDAEVSVLQKPVTQSSGLGRAIIEAMLQPVPLYIASASSPKEKYGTAIGDFVYVDGGFRYLDTEVSQALSTAPPLRIRIGGNVQRAKIIRKVSPVYPEEAKAAHIAGTVVLHVVLAADGTVREVTLVSGDPVLAKAAVEAVRQWHYQPTLLNGKAVEVDTVISVDFRFN